MADRIKNYQQEADQITTLKAIRTDLGVTPSSYTPDATVVTKDRVVTYAQAEEELVVLSDIEKGVKQQIVDVDITQKDIANIKALLQGHLYDYQTDTNSAYTKSVPSGAMPYAGLEKVGGKTIVYNQLYGTYIQGFGGLTRVSDCVYHMNRTLNNTGYVLFDKYGIAGHKYYFAVKGYVSTQQQQVYVNIANGTPTLQSTSVDAFNSAIFDNTRDWYVYLVFTAGTYTDVTITCKCIDMTLMFGAGNEPTKEQFEAMFPADTYPFSAGTLLSAGVTSVVSKDTNNATLQTYSIPAEVQALEGYGWSAGTAYNYIDFERKVFVQNVGRVEIIASDVSLANTYTNIDYYKVSKPTNYSGYSTYKSTKTEAPIINEKFIPIDISYPPVYDSATNIGCVDGTSNNVNFWFGFAKNTTLEQAKSALVGTHIYYELATPVEVDISEYLTDDNLINVDSGGTLTFPNSNGDDYRLPVPSEETYMIDLQASLGG